MAGFQLSTEELAMSAREGVLDQPFARVA